MKKTNVRKDCRFLIVDDQVQMQQILKSLLKSAGFRKVAFAESGRDALRIISKKTIDFIIADWYMPRMDGMELLKLVRSNPQYCTVPFLMITGEMSEKKVLYANEEGVNGFLTKPVTQQEVVNEIEEILEAHEAAGITEQQLNTVRKLKLEKNFSKAIELGNRFFSSSNEPDAHILMGECYLGKKDIKRAKKRIAMALQARRDSRSLNLMGKILIAENKIEDGIQYMKDASSLNPMNLTRKIDIGTIYLNLGLEEDAMEVFQSMPETELTDLNLTDIGSAYLSAGHVQKAGEYLDNVSDPIPESISVYNKYAIELRKAGEFEESVKQYKRCLQIEPEHYVILYNLGKLYFEMEMHDKAVDALDRSVKSRANEKAEKLLNFIKSSRY